MPMIQLVEQISSAVPRQIQGGRSFATTAWRSNDVNAENLARLGERNSKTESDMCIY